MLKKFLLAVAVVLGVIYGSGSDLASVKRSILNAADGNARGLTADSNEGWGEGSGY